MCGLSLLRPGKQKRGKGRQKMEGNTASVYEKIRSREIRVPVACPWIWNFVGSCVYTTSRIIKRNELKFMHVTANPRFPSPSFFQIDSVTLLTAIGNGTPILLAYHLHILWHFFDPDPLRFLFRVPSDAYVSTFHGNKPQCKKQPISFPAHVSIRQRFSSNSIRSAN